MTTYGVYLAYPPSVDLRREGLGRHLGAFLKAGTGMADTKLVVACPSWSRKAIEELCVENDIPVGSISFLGPRQRPVLLRIYDWHRARQRLKRPRRSRWRRKLQLRLYRHLVAVVSEVAGSRNVIRFGLLALYAGLLGILATPFIAIYSVVALIRKLFGLRQRLGRHMPGSGAILALRQKIDQRYHQFLNAAFYKMEARETEALTKMASRDDSVRAWYCPTAFWPEFNKLTKPKLMCVPDIVVSEFPAGFALFGGSHLRFAFSKIARSVRAADNLVTYSNKIRSDVIGTNWLQKTAKVHVISHAAQDLDLYRDHALSDEEAVAEVLLKNFRASHLEGYASRFQYIFYASQFRPSKNVLTLLRSYDYLLKERNIGHKLILTGEPLAIPAIADFIDSRNLSRDVLCLQGINARQLSAFYSRADLAVNPSLSEGGMPFTFSEALSVGTPAVMADIEVTREIITDPDVAAASLFDPYDWKAMANKIEWALFNRDALYAKQRAFHDAHLARRTWHDVVAEHIALMDTIASNSDRRFDR
jgi:glycosyltransferase involved in cell wall biosynthesis